MLQKVLSPIRALMAAVLNAPKLSGIEQPRIKMRGITSSDRPFAMGAPDPVGTLPAIGTPPGAVPNRISGLHAPERGADETLAEYRDRQKRSAEAALIMATGMPEGDPFSLPKERKAKRVYATGQNPKPLKVRKHKQKKHKSFGPGLSTTLIGKGATRRPWGTPLAGVGQL